MTRIAYVCADPGIPVFGHKGASVHVQEVVRALRARGAGVELVAARLGGMAPPDLADVPVHVLAEARAGTSEEREAAARRTSDAVAAVLDDLGAVDLVYERYSLWGRMGMAWAASVDVPGVLEVNAPLIDEQARYRTLHDRNGAEEVARLAIGAATVVLAVSRPVAAWAVGMADDGCKVHVVPNGVDVDRISPAEGWVPMAGAVCTVGFVGTLKPWHGLETLAEAFVVLANHDPAYRLLVVGGGPGAVALHARLAAAGVTERTEVVGSVDPQQVPALLRRMDVAVAPYSASAGYFSPLKVFEYLAAGLPVVASRVGQIPCLIDHGRTGVLCDPGDAGALAAAIQELWVDPGRAAVLGAAGRAMVRRDHTWLAVADRILDLAGVTTCAGA